MQASGFHLCGLRDERLAPLATSALPAWLWSIDASRLIWANPVGAAIFGAATPAAISTRRFGADHPGAVQIARLARTLRMGAPPRLERLREFGAGLGRPLTCACTHVLLADGRDTILVVATERAGPDLPLAERARRLICDGDAAVAAFAATGELLAASDSARPHLQGAASLDALGAQALAGEALARGHASDTVLAIDRIGADASTVLVASFATPTPAVDSPAPVAAPAAEAPIASTQPDASSPEAPVEALEVEATVAAPAPEAPIAAPAAFGEAGAPAPVETASTRRHPLRFVWQMDEAGRFTVDADEFAALAGARTAHAIGQPWMDVAAELGLDPTGQVTRALATRDTWSGVSVAWPVDDSTEPLTVELSGLPVFDRERTFRGYRGFGVCRDIGRLAALAQRRQAPAQPKPVAEEDTAHTTPAETAAVNGAAAAAAPVRLLERARLVENVVPIRSGLESGVPALSAIERNAFRELSRKLSQRLTAAGIKHNDASALPATDEEHAALEPEDVRAEDLEAQDMRMEDLRMEDLRAEDLRAEDLPAGRSPIDAALGVQPVLDQLPVGVLVYRLDHLIYANPAFLRWSGHGSLEALRTAGGLDEVFVGSLGAATAGGEPALRLAIDSGDRISIASELIPIQWEGEPAQALVMAQPIDKSGGEPGREPGAAGLTELAELKSVLDIATDGVVIIDRQGRIVSANRGAQALFGYGPQELSGRAFDDLFAAESIDAAHACLDDLAGEAPPPGGGREVVGRTREGGTIALAMSMGELGDGKLCAVFRDVTPWKTSEQELVAARRRAESASSAKSDFIAKVSHEIRTPLNAIIGFAEVMIEERFGPVGSERYRDYLKDIHASGAHLLSLVNDLLDLSKIEAGKLELTVASVALNDLTQQCVAIMQPQANRKRIIVRTSLPQALPPVLADARSLRQIVLNLLSNSIKFTGAGGQVIVSTAHTDDGAIVLRVRDTGVGMSETDLLTALEPFGQVATSPHSGGTGLGLPLTKALAEANRAHFQIKSAPQEGTLVEITFPADRVLAG